MENSKRLQRNTQDRVVGGVCSGLADYFGIDTALMRVVFAILLFAGVGFLAYLIFWIVMPAAKSAESQPADTNQAVVEQKGRGAWVAGLSLIVIGCLCLLNNVLPRFNWIAYWPVLIIVLGIVLIVPHKKRES